MTHTKIKSFLNSAIDSVEGSSTTKNELLDFFGLNEQSPSSSAFFQQRGKLKPDALKEVFDIILANISSS